MKFLIIADLHGNLTRREYDSIGEIDFEGGHRFDAVILLGDILPNGIIECFMATEYLPCREHIYGVFGNHDDENCAAAFEKCGIENIHGKLVTLNGVTFTGFEGSSKYKDDEYQYTQKESLEICKSVPKADILFSHDCAYGSKCAARSRERIGYRSIQSTQAHCGLKGIARYVKEKKPMYHFHGHHHKTMYCTFGHTKTFCVYRCAVANTDGGNCTVESLLYGRNGEIDTTPF